MADITQETNRKPQVTEKEPAQVVLNRFLKERDILLGTQRPQIDFTDKGQMLINSPQIIAVYANDAKVGAN